MPTVLLTICSIRQLPQALALGDNYRQFAANGNSEPILIGLADDPAHLPADFNSPFPLLPIRDLLPAEQLITLSAMYTPTEFSAACKPLFITEAFRRYPNAERLIYADPNIHFTDSLTPILANLADATIILTPFITRPPVAAGQTNKLWPDEKFFQNIGLYSSDFLVFRRSPETDRLLAWWDNRVRERAFIDFCSGLCLDQLWLMHVPVLFQAVAIAKHPGWQVALWNLSERALQLEDNRWLVQGPTGAKESLLFVNFKGLQNPDEGFFTHQTQVRLSGQSAISSLLVAYRQLVGVYSSAAFEASVPAYGQQPEPVVVRGWRYAAIRSMQVITRFLDRVHVPAIH